MDADHHVDPAPVRSAPPKHGRPRIFDEEIAREICERIGDGERLHDICSHEHMPKPFTVMHWCQTDPKFACAYKAALHARAQLRCEEMLAIAANGENDVEKGEPDADGIPTVRPNKEALGRSELRITTLKWILAHELPEQYGQRTQLPLPTSTAPEAPIAAPAPPPPPSALEAIDPKELLAAMGIVPATGIAVAATK